MEMIMQQLKEIREALGVLIERQQVREFYEVDQFAALTGKAAFTVREYCRNGRLHALKRRSGRGGSTSWVISHEEYRRFQREGLLPIKPR